MGSPSPDELCWIIEPLFQAGLELEEIKSLVFGLGFAGIISTGQVPLTVVRDLVRDQPAEIQAAWSHTIGRMLAFSEPAEPS